MKGVANATLKVRIPTTQTSQMGSFITPQTTPDEGRKRRANRPRRRSPIIRNVLRRRNPSRRIAIMDDSSWLLV